MSETHTIPTSEKSPSTLSLKVGERSIQLEWGRFASQATATVCVQCEDSMVVVPLVAMGQSAQEANFLPLSVHYSKRKYADGQVPGARDRREGRPTTMETLTSRLIDRPLRATFPSGFYNEVQIAPMAVSSNPNIRSDVLAMLGASTALALSGLPCAGPVAAVRVGYIEEKFVINPTQVEIDQSALDLVIAGTEQAILMVEGEANALSKEVIIDAILFGHEEIKSIAKQIAAWVKKSGTQPQWDWKPKASNTELESKVKALIDADLEALYATQDKKTRKVKREALRQRIIEAFYNKEAGVSENQLDALLKSIESEKMKEKVFNEKRRLDGRAYETIRPIRIETGLLPRAHGSSLFTRGDTQALVVATLGSERDAELVEDLDGITRKDTFILHYNFPPYSVGEVGQMGSPKRREIGHGNLAKRAMRAVLPSERDCPYVLRVVSEVMSSNGSSSMATVCGTSLSLMDAGIALKSHVAGIAMGLVKREDQFVVLSDISEEEDHIGAMDLKVAGTREGITALQMDIKTDGITRDILSKALSQAQDGIGEILGKMEQVMAGPNQKVSAYAPQIMETHIPVDKIQALIGKGGATIRGITEETGTLIDIHRETGLIRISSPDASACEQAIQKIKEVTDIGPEVEIGLTYDGTVLKLLQSGAIVSILPGRRGFVHISEMLLDHPEQEIAELLKEKQRIKVKVLDIDRQKNKIKLTMKDVVVEAVDLPEAAS